MDLPFAVTTPMRDPSTLTAPGYEMPAGATDVHFHVFEEGYPHVSDPQYTFPDGTLDKYLAMTRALGIDRMVLVQPTYYGDDNTLTLDTLDRLGDRSRGVIRVTPDTDGAMLADYDRRGVRAIRLDLFARKTWAVADLETYIREMAALAGPIGWHLQFYSPGSVIRDLIPFLSTLEVPFVIDHMGYMKASDGFGSADLDRLLGLLDSGACWIKLTGPYRVAGDAPMSTVAPLGRALVSRRPDRLLWGSDWPHLPDGQRDTGELLDLLAEWAPDPADRERILVTGPDILFFSH